MQRHFHILFSALFAALFIFSCGSEEGNSTTQTPADTTAKDTAKVVDKVENNPNPSISFADELKMFVDKVFPEFKEVKMEEKDATPKFKTATKSVYKRLQRRQPIPTEMTNAAYPRVFVKVWQFADSTTLNAELTGWLNSHESSDANIELGENVDNLKSPPLLCAVVANTVLMVQYACVYNGPEWDKNTEAFFAAMKEKNARYVWEIQCNSGKLEYQ